MIENNEHKIVKEAQKIINDYIEIIEKVYEKPKKRALKKVIGFIFAGLIIGAITLTFIKI